MHQLSHELDVKTPVRRELGSPPPCFPPCILSILFIIDKAPLAHSADALLVLGWSVPESLYTTSSGLRNLKSTGVSWCFPRPSAAN